MQQATEPEEEPVYYASHLKRLAAFLLDLTILIIILSFGVGYLLGGQELGDTEPEIMEQVMALQGSQQFFWMVVGTFIVYFAVFQASDWQATPGKKIMRLYVTDLNGDKLSWGQSFWRAAIETANFIILGGLPALLALFHPHGQTAHDLIAKTYVLGK